jgi:hypothetical protein
MTRDLLTLREPNGRQELMHLYSTQRAAGPDPAWPTKQLDKLRNSSDQDFEHWMLATIPWDHRRSLYDLHADQLEWFDHCRGWDAYLKKE